MPMKPTLWIFRLSIISEHSQMANITLGKVIKFSEKLSFGGSFAFTNNILLKHNFSLLKPLNCDRLEESIWISHVYEIPIDVGIWYHLNESRDFQCVSTSLSSHYFKN